MVRHYKRKSDRGLSYTREQLTTAIEEIQRGVCSLHQASERFNIPYSTLQKHIKGTRGAKSSSHGRSTIIPFEKEEQLANGLKTLEKWGWGLTRKEVLELVGSYVRHNNIPNSFKDCIPGEDWFLGFKRRHRLSIKKPQTLEYARKKSGSDPFIIEGYFDILQQTLIDLDIENKPKQIFNIDETSFCLDPTKTKVVGQTNAPSSRVTAGPARESTTVLLGGNANGEKLPPLIVFKGKNIWDTWMAPTRPHSTETCYAASTNGWMESDIFFNYFDKTFLKFCGSDRPILLIYDGHTTHIDDRVIDSAIKNDITIIKLPPHSSHMLQPMDLAVFKSLKSVWDQRLTRHQRHQQGVKISKRDFSELLSTIWNDTSPDLLKKGFEKAGIFPYNRDVIDKNKYYDPLAYSRYLASRKKSGAEPNPVPAYENAAEESVDILTKSLPPQILAEFPAELTPKRVNVSEPGCSSSIGSFSSIPENLSETPEPTNVSISSDVSFESLLLETVRQRTPPSKVQKKRIAPGAEVITFQDSIAKENEEKKKKNDTEKTKQKNVIYLKKGLIKKKISMKQRSTNLSKETPKKVVKQKRFKLIQVGLGQKRKRIKVESTSEESECDEYLYSIDEESKKVTTIEDLRAEMLEKFEEEQKDEALGLEARKLTVGNYVLVSFATKSSKNLHFVGQVNQVNECGDPQVIFLRCKSKAKIGTTFYWPEKKDEYEVPSTDVITVLPEPTLGRRGDLTFGVVFDSYNIQ